MIISFAVLFMIPAIIDIVIGFANNPVLSNLASFTGNRDWPFVTKAGLDTFSKFIISVTAFLLLILPNANVLIANLATEFVSVNDYIEYGAQRQLIQGNLEKLVDYISEKEINCKIHFHTYSFGSILAIDYIYPFGNKPSKNAQRFCESIITIGTPFEFINSYYSSFYQKRFTELGDSLCWINVYSIADALATNFRIDNKIGEAQFGINQSSNKPINLNYEVNALNKKGIIDFILLYSIKIHGMYWDDNTEGQSCLSLVYEEMSIRKLL